MIRAELPGLDPDKDVKITIEDNTLVIAAERTREKVRQDPLRIPYGAFRRAMTLPTGGEGRRHQGDLHGRHPDRRDGLGGEPASQARQIPVARGRPRGLHPFRRSNRGEEAEP